jgi:NAD(P)H-dependent flavin oxidoreductase YrpB (nitropropane dioxygenase family)
LTGYKNARQLAHFAIGFKGYKLSIQEGDNDEGFLPIGQATGLIHDNPTVAELISRIIREAQEVKAKLDATFA